MMVGVACDTRPSKEAVEDPPGSPPRIQMGATYAPGYQSDSWPVGRLSLHRLGEPIHARPGEKPRYGWNNPFQVACFTASRNSSFDRALLDNKGYRCSDSLALSEGPLAAASAVRSVSGSGPSKTVRGRFIVFSIVFLKATGFALSGVNTDAALLSPGKEGAVIHRARSR